MKKKLKNKKVSDIHVIIFSRILSGLFLIITTILLIVSLFNFLSFHTQTYQDVTVNQAVEKLQSSSRLLVTLKDAKINCINSIKVANTRRGYTLYINITNADEKHSIIGLYRQVSDCQELFEEPLVGSFERIKPQEYEIASSKGLLSNKEISLENVYTLCTYCTPENSLIGTIFIVLAWIASIFYVVKFFKM